MLLIIFLISCQENRTTKDYVEIAFRQNENKIHNVVRLFEKDVAKQSGMTFWVSAHSNGFCSFRFTTNFGNIADRKWTELDHVPLNDKKLISLLKQHNWSHESFKELCNSLLLTGFLSISTSQIQGNPVKLFNSSQGFHHCFLLVYPSTENYRVKDDKMSNSELGKRSKVSCLS